MTNQTKTVKSYSITWQDRSVPYGSVDWDFNTDEWRSMDRNDGEGMTTEDLNLALATFNHLAQNEKPGYFYLKLYETTNVLTYDAEDDEWVYDELNREVIQKLEFNWED